MEYSLLIFKSCRSIPKIHILLLYRTNLSSLKLVVKQKQTRKASSIQTSNGDLTEFYDFFLDLLSVMIISNLQIIWSRSQVSFTPNLCLLLPTQTLVLGRVNRLKSRPTTSCSNPNRQHILMQVQIVCESSVTRVEWGIRFKCEGSLKCLGLIFNSG